MTLAPYEIAGGLFLICFLVILATCLCGADMTRPDADGSETFVRYGVAAGIIFVATFGLGIFLGKW